MRKILVIAIAIVMAVTVIVSPAFAQATPGYGPLMGMFWGAGDGPALNGYGLGYFGTIFPQLMLQGPGPYGIGGFGSAVPFLNCWS
ncbi:MAG: DUF4179 domain-containing protein [Methanocella sp.]